MPKIKLEQKKRLRQAIIAYTNRSFPKEDRDFRDRVVFDFNRDIMTWLGKMSKHERNQRLCTPERTITEYYGGEVDGDNCNRL